MSLQRANLPTTLISDLFATKTSAKPRSITPSSRYTQFAPTKLQTSDPAVTSQILISLAVHLFFDLSPDPVTMRVPSSEKAIESTGAVWPVSVHTCYPPSSQKTWPSKDGCTAPQPQKTPRHAASLAKVSTSVPVVESQIFKDESSEPLTIYFPSSEYPTRVTLPEWPVTGHTRLTWR